jgi:hypothetical protein
MRRPHTLLALSLLALAALAAACGGDDDAPSSTPGTDGNLLANAGFEAGEDPWIGLHGGETDFAVTDAQALSGTNSALLHMRDVPNDEGEGATHSKVYYLVQEITPEAMPEVVRGNYFVENWVEGAPHQYLQFVIIAFDPENFEAGNWQIRYPLAGIDSQPFAIGNAKFNFVSREAPVQGQWVPFEVHPRDDFEELWGQVPEGFTSLRLLFEVRWDNKVFGEGSPSADVYYDDLYAGDD